MTPPTPRQVEVLRAIAEFQGRKGYPISVRELGDVLGIASTNGVQDNLKALAKKGLVSRDTNVARSIQLTQAGRAALGEGM